MNSLLYIYVEKALSDVSLNEQYRVDTLPHIKKDFSADLELYMKASKQNKYKRSRTVNTVLYHISLFPFLTAANLQAFTEVFTETVCRTSFHRETMIFPENVEVFAFDRALQILKDKYSLLPLLLLSGFLDLATTKATEDDVMNQDMFAASVITDPTAVKLLWNPDYVPSRREMDRAVKRKTEEFRLAKLKKILRYLGNPTVLYDELKIKELGELRNFKIFLSSLSNFFTHYTYLDCVNICQGCNKLFYNVGRFAYSCSPTCNNRRKAGKYYRRAQAEKKLFYSPRTYNFV